MSKTQQSSNVETMSFLKNSIYFIFIFKETLGLKTGICYTNYIFFGAFS
jgi:hypothetical protein